MDRQIRHQAVLMLAVNTLYMLAGALAGTFLNVYIWKSRPDFAAIGWFAAAQQLALGLSFWLGGKWVKEYQKMNALRVGLAVSGIFYLAVLLAGTNAASYIWPLGLLLGLSIGLFWLASNTIYFEITDAENRDFWGGWMGLLGSLTGIVGPWTSGWLITRLNGTRGYRMVFIASLCLYILAAILSFFLRKRPAGSGYLWLEPWRELRRSGSHWRPAAAALMFQGVREGVFSFLIGLLVYIAARKESGLGQFTLITSAVALVSYWLAGKWFKPRYRSAGMLTGAVLLVLVITPLLWKVNYMTLLAMGIGTSLFLPLYMLPMLSTGFDLMGETEEAVEKRVELVVLRELSLMTGRLLGTAVFLVVLSFSQSATVLTGLLLALGASPLGGWLALRRLLQAER